MQPLSFLLALLPLFHGTDASTDLPRVRTANSRVAAAVHEGVQRSPSFRAVMAQLRNSNVVVHVVVADCSCRSARACLTFVTGAGSIRYLRASVSLRQIQKELTAQIGHELFHAAEIGRAPEVIDRTTLRQFYQRRGHRVCGANCGYETADAGALERRVRTELETDQAR